MIAQPVGRAAKPGDRSRWLSLYVFGVALVGLAIIVVALVQLSQALLFLLVFAGLAVVTEMFSAELFSNSRSRVSASSIIAIAGILIVGPLAGALVEMASGLATTVTSTLLQRQIPKRGRASWLQRLAFNLGMLATAQALAGWTYMLAGGRFGHVLQLDNLLPLALAVSVNALVNQALLIGVVALQTGQRPLDIWKRDLQWGTPIVVAGGIVGGGALALAYEQFGLLGLALFFLPILTIGYSFRLYVNHTRMHVNRLEEMNQALDETNTGLLEALGAIIDADDVYTYGHSNQISAYAGAIAEKMKLSEAEHSIIAKAALIHDIGKIGVADSIIGKPGRLTADEYELMKRHTVIGAEIVGRMKGLQELVPIVRHHHEHWDGAGYPDGLAGMAIPLGARIVAVADAVEAMCSDRPYRPSRTFSKVLQEIRRCSGTQFDPDVVNAFVTVAEEKGSDFFTNSAAAVDRHVLLDAAAVADTKSRHLKKSMLIDRERDPDRPEPSISVVGAPQV